MMIDGDQISDMVSKCSIALFFANLLDDLELRKDALEYCGMALECSEQKIKRQALRLKEVLELKRA